MHTAVVLQSAQRFSKPGRIGFYKTTIRPFRTSHAKQFACFIVLNPRMHTTVVLQPAIERSNYTIAHKTKNPPRQTRRVFCYFVLFAVRMHFTHALTRESLMTAHWRFGYFLFLVVGLYFPLNFLSTVDSVEVFPHTSHARGIGLH